MSVDQNFPAAALQRAIDHMNEDHRDSMVDMVKAFAGCHWAADAELVSIDPRGFELWALGGGRREMARIAFDEPLTSAQQLRDAMVTLARRARAQVADDGATAAAAPVLAIDGDTWPLVMITFRGAVTPDDIGDFTAGIDRFLAREEPFGALILAHPDYLASQRDNAVAARLMLWVKAARPALTAHCRGIAYVIEDDDFRAAIGPMMEEQGEKIYGSPLRIFATADEARAWLIGLLR